MLQPRSPAPLVLVPTEPYPTPVPVARAVKAVLAAPESVMEVVVAVGLSTPRTTSFGSAAAAVSGRAALAAVAAMAPAAPAAAASSARRERGFDDSVSNGSLQTDGRRVSRRWASRDGRTEVSDVRRAFDVSRSLAVGGAHRRRSAVQHRLAPGLRGADRVEGVQVEPRDPRRRVGEQRRQPSTKPVGL